MVREPAVVPFQLLQIALQQGADLEKLKTLMDLQERWEANQARKAYVSAMADFKSNVPQIVKDRRVSFNTNKGPTEYDHATLGAACTAIVEGLARVRISHSWKVAQRERRVQVICTLTHELGHSDSVQIEAGEDDSGGKNSIQAIGSAITYLERYSLFAACGLAPVSLPDDDGRRAGAEVALITEKQAADLHCKIDEVGANRAQFLRYLKVERLEDLPASRFNAAVQALNDKAKGVR